MTDDHKVIRATKGLTQAQRFALMDAYEGRLIGPTFGKFFLHLSVRADVVGRLREKGLLSRRSGWGLTKLGERVRAELRK